MGMARRIPEAIRRRITAPVRGGSDRGAITALVAVLAAGGVLLGLGAVVVDVGQLYAERERLQTGADAAALAVARACASTPSACGNQTGLAQTYANANGWGGTSSVTVVCGRAPGLPNCPPAATNLTACLGTPPSAGTYVEVRTATRRPDGSTLLPPTFAGALLGGGYRGSQVAACARVAFGSPSTASGFAVTVSSCEWNTMTGGGASYWSPPGTALPPASTEKPIYLHNTTGASTCPAGPSGWDAPGGFGWLDDPTGTCTATVSAGGTYGGNTGASASNPCQSALQNAYTNRQQLLVPVYDGIAYSGTHTTYHLAGFSAFVLTGWWLPGSNAKSWLSGRNLCTGSNKCLYGYFTTGLLPATATLSLGTNYGITAIHLIG
jgi:Flp pilus assembly protein TadG